MSGLDSSFAEEISAELLAYIDDGSYTQSQLIAGLCAAILEVVGKDSSRAQAEMLLGLAIDMLGEADI